MLKTTTVVGTVAIVATAAYLCYFDFKRRSDKSFRKAVKVSKSKAQAEHQRITKERVLEAKSRASSSVPGQFLAQLENDPLPITQQDKEACMLFLT